MSEYIVDFQAFKNANNEFIVKELAILSTDEQIYELHLFQPPFSFSQLPPHLQKQVIWLEKQYHGLTWSSGVRPYSDLKEIFRGINICGTVLVKGSEKQTFISNLLSEFNIKVLNLDDLNCPNFNILKKQFWNESILKPCVFEHNMRNCAYIHAGVLLQWWKLEKCIQDRLQAVNLAIKDCHTKGYKGMQEELVKYLPKEFLLNHVENIENVYNKLPIYLRKDLDILNSFICTEHQNCNLLPIQLKKKDCFYCSTRILQ